MEVGQVIAGPFCGQLLGCVISGTLVILSLILVSSQRHFGAEVIKVEPPGVGDPLRVWRELDQDGVSPWWRSIARNKKSVTIDLRKEEGRACGKLSRVQAWSVRYGDLERFEFARRGPKNGAV